MTVVGIDETDESAVDMARWGALAEAVLDAEGIAETAELDLVFVDRDAMATLNFEHMGQQGPTDVLAFPLDGTDQSPGPVLLGDVVICPAVAAANASAAGHGVDDEISLLVVHGILHVLGMDHAEPDEAAEMQARERDLLALCSQP